MKRVLAAVMKPRFASRFIVTGAMGKTDHMRPNRLQPAKAGREEPDDGEVGRAFDLWLRRGLHQMYDTVAREPVPDVLLHLIEADRLAKKK